MLGFAVRIAVDVERRAFVYDSATETLRYRYCGGEERELELALDPALREQLIDEARRVDFFALPPIYKARHELERGATLHCSPRSDLWIRISADERSHEVYMSCMIGRRENELSGLESALARWIYATIDERGEPPTTRCSVL
jgi:hypothetical protein